MKARIENRFLKEVELIRRTAQEKKMFWLISPQNYGSLFCISLTESKHMGEDEFLFSFNENEREIKNRLDLRKNLPKNISMKYIRITPEKRRMNTRKSFRSRKV